MSDEQKRGPDTPKAYDIETAAVVIRVALCGKQPAKRAAALRRTATWLEHLAAGLREAEGTAWPPREDRK